jgi:hypothetical protein
MPGDRAPIVAAAIATARIFVVKAPGPPADEAATAPPPDGASELQPDPAEPDPAEPGPSQPGPSQPDASEPGASEPGASQRGTSRPDTSQPDPDAAEAGGSSPGGGRPTPTSPYGPGGALLTAPRPRGGSGGRAGR